MLFKQFIVGTPYYLAPEVLEANKYSKASDLYSLDITLWELFEQKIPFYHIPYLQDDHINSIRKLDMISRDNLRPKIQEIANYKALEELIIKLWDKTPRNREQVSLKDIYSVIENLVPVNNLIL